MSECAELIWGQSGKYPRTRLRRSECCLTRSDQISVVRFTRIFTAHLAPMIRGIRNASY
jgi:hypothetical protein